MLALAGLSIFSFARLHAEQTVFVPEGQMTQYDRVVVTTHENEIYTLEIDGNSTIHSYKNADEVFVVDVLCKGAYYYHFHRDEIKSIRFLESEDQSIIIEDLHAVEDDHSFVVRYDDGEILMSGAAVGQICYIRNIGGKVERSFFVQQSGRVSIDDLRPGIYIVTIGRYTLKVIKR